MTNMPLWKYVTNTLIESCCGTTYLPILYYYVKLTAPCSLTVCATTAFGMPPMTKCTVRAISNTVHINGFRCRRACSVSSLMFHRVNRTSRYPSGWFGVVGQAPLPRRGIREGDPFCGPVAYAAWGWWVSERSSLSAQSPLGAKILPVEQTIRRWRVGTGQHAS